MLPGQARPVGPWAVPAPARRPGLPPHLPPYLPSPAPCPFHNRYWHGFLASTLSSAQLLAFAMWTFAAAPPGIKAKLVAHLVTDPAGAYLIRVYTGKNREQWEGVAGGSASGGRGSLAAAAALAQLAAAAEQGG